MFLGAVPDFKFFFVKKLCFSVLELNSTEVNGSRFISGKQFHLKVEFRVYRGQ